MFKRVVMIIFNTSILIPFIFFIGIAKIMKSNLIGIGFVLAAVLLIILQILLKGFAEKKLVPKKINIMKITRDSDSWIFAMYISYILPFLEIIIEKGEDVFTGILVVIGIVLLVVSHKALENPVFRAFSYKIYHVETAHGFDCILWSKKEPRNLKTINKVVRLSENIYLEVD